MNRPDFDFRSDVHRPSLFCPLLTLEQNLDRAYRVQGIAGRRLQMALLSREKFSTYEWASYWFSRAAAHLDELKDMIERREVYAADRDPNADPRAAEIMARLRAAASKPTWGIWREEAQPVRGSGWVELAGARLECHEEQARNIVILLDEMTAVEGVRYEAREIRL